MSEEIKEIPAVGKSFYVPCKKCGTDRYHIVLAHKTERSAKIKCEVCGSQKSYSLPKAQVRRNTSGLTAARAAKAAASESAKRNSHTAEYEKLLNTDDSKPAQTYNMRIRFELHHKLQHPKFGLGVVRAVQSDKIEVVFQDEVRNLVHNRT